MTWLYPVRTGLTFFDFWTFQHFSFWFVVGGVLFPHQAPFLRSLVVCVMVAYAWEIFERYAEKAWPLLWQNPESWLNAYVSDPLMVPVGLACAYVGYTYGRP